MSIRFKNIILLFIYFFSTALFADVSVSVDIQGVNSEIEKNIRLYLSIEQQSKITNISPSRLHLLHQIATQEIRKAIQPYGYYQASIESSLTNSEKNNWLASYKISLGSPIIISQYDFKTSPEIVLDDEFTKLLKKLQIHKGEIFNHVRYETLKTELALLAAERGYFEARFSKHEVTVNLENFSAEIQLHFVSGKRYHFGHVKLQQNILNPEFLKRYIPFKKLDPYTFSNMLELQQSLSDSDYFRTVEVSPLKIDSTKLEVPVTVLLTPQTHSRYSVGVGYGSDTRARAKLRWEIPLLNSSGHRISAETRVSELGYNVSAQYRVPVYNPRSDQIIYNTSIENRITETSENTVRTIGASLNHNRGAWRESIALNYQQEVFFIASAESRVRTLIPSISWTRIWGGDFINIFDGLRLDFSVRGASDDIFSDANFYQVTGSLKGINPLGKSNRLISRGKLGGTWLNEFEQLPKSLRFFSGGATSVRGYGFETLAPVNDRGEIVGGQYLMEGSLELEHSFNEKWGAAIFIDAGSAINDLNDKLARGAGIGLRWRSPIGPVRIDLANALSRNDRPWRLHITIGPDL